MSSFNTPRNHSIVDEQFSSMSEENRLLTFETSWLERLCMNLLSYSVILLPIALMVIATRYRLFPDSILSSSMLQRFVYGSCSLGENRSRRGHPNDLTQSQAAHQTLLGEKLRFDPLGRSYESNTQSWMIIDFIWCLVGLLVSYLGSVAGKNHDISLPCHDNNLLGAT